MLYTLGLDIGNASVGWCVIDNDNKQIAKTGVRIFDSAENPKTGASLALPRREARSSRRRLRRRVSRLNKLKNLFFNIKLTDEDNFERIFYNNQLKGPYTLRAEGLDRMLFPDEWVKVLYHICKHRGFKSNRKTDLSGKDKKEGELLEGVKSTKNILNEKGYRSLGEMFVRDEHFKENIRNKGGSYKNTIGRDMLEKEIILLFEKQRDFGNDYSSVELENSYLEIFNSQKPVASGDAILAMTSNCTFEKDEKRAPKNSFTAERFMLLDKVTKLRVYDNGERKGITPENQKLIMDFAYSHSKINYKQIRSLLNIDSNIQFVGVDYNQRNKNTKGSESEKNETVNSENQNPKKRKKEDKGPEDSDFAELKGYNEIRKALEKSEGKQFWENVKNNSEMLDDIAYALTFYKTDNDIRGYLKNKKITENIIDPILSVNFNKVSHLSFKAMKNIIPFMEQGFGYSEACEKAGYNHYNPGGDSTKSKFLPVIERDEIRNPVVFRAITQTRKVINAIIREYGSPYSIHIEMARDLLKSKKEKDDIKKLQDNYKNEKTEIVEHYKELFNANPSGDSLLKYRLWREQKGYCPYSQEYLDSKRLHETGYVQIDHIIPFSLSFDNSMSNKVLACVKCNQEKKRRIPFDYLGGPDSEKWKIFESWVGSNIRNSSKKQKLVRKSFNEKDSEEIKDRNLNDTRYICRLIKKLISEKLEFADAENKSPVRTINGAMTAFLRHCWGFDKKREESNLHHAVDAAVVAAASQGMVKLVAEYSKNKELYDNKKAQYFNPETDEVSNIKYKDSIDISRFPKPWENFRKELLARIYGDENDNSIKPVFVSRMPFRKIDGAAHEETIFSAKALDKGYKTVRKPLIDIDLKTLEKMAGKERDKLLYEALKSRLEINGNDPKKAFAEPFYKPARNGSSGSIVRSIRVIENGTTGLLVRNGIADNDKMIRCDVFIKKGKYYLVPVYVSDMVKYELPNKAIIAHKDESEWTLIDESFSFLFSLYKNDLVLYEKNDEKVFGYYIGCDRDSGRISILANDEPLKDNSQRKSTKTATKLEKYVVDVLGNYYPVKKEIRKELHEYKKKDKIV